MQATARHLRRHITPAETRLWERLRGRQIAGVKFRRQHAIGGCILDFYCPAARLAIEVDGPVHMQQRTADAARDALLAAKGIRVLRLSNDDVFLRLEETTQRIATIVRESQDEQTPSRRPHPHGRSVNTRASAPPIPLAGERDGG